MELGYLRDNLFYIYPSHPIKQEGHVVGASTKEFHLARSRQCAFSAVVPTLWNINPPEVRLAPSLLAFWKDFFSQPCGPMRSQQSSCVVPSDGSFSCYVGILCFIY